MVSCRLITARSFDQGGEEEDWDEEEEGGRMMVCCVGKQKQESDDDREECERFPAANSRSAYHHWIECIARGLAAVHDMTVAPPRKLPVIFYRFPRTSANGRGDETWLFSESWRAQSIGDDIST
jgi:hypothetical protein